MLCHWSLCLPPENIKKPLEAYPLHEKWSFCWKVFLVNVSKSADNCEYAHVYERDF